MDELIASAICLSLALVGLGFVWYANETRKHEANLRVQSLDLAIQPGTEHFPAHLHTERAGAYHRFLHDQPVIIRPMPSRAEDISDAELDELAGHVA